AIPRTGSRASQRCHDLGPVAERADAALRRLSDLDREAGAAAQSAQRAAARLAIGCQAATAGQLIQTVTDAERTLRERVAAQGHVTVAEFMETALSGYYADRDPLGAAGDFTTAPEVSQMFGELIGLWAADLWSRMGKPDPFLLVELGPGRGTLMADAL